MKQVDNLLLTWEHNYVLLTVRTVGEGEGLSILGNI